MFCRDNFICNQDPCRVSSYERGKERWKKTRELDVPQECIMYVEYCLLEWNKE